MISLVMTVVALSTSGGLLSELTPAAGLLVGQADLDVPIRSYESMSLSELGGERLRLLDNMPSPGLGIALTAIGGGVFLVGFSIFLFVDILVGVILMVAGVPLLIIGPILLVNALANRREAHAQIRLIDQRMGQLKRDEFQPPPFDSNPNDTPPPPPMRPPASELMPTIAPQLQLASF